MFFSYFRFFLVLIAKSWKSQDNERNYNLIGWQESNIIKILFQLPQNKLRAGTFIFLHKHFEYFVWLQGALKPMWNENKLWSVQITIFTIF